MHEFIKVYRPQYIKRCFSVYDITAMPDKVPVVFNFVKDNSFHGERVGRAHNSVDFVSLPHHFVSDIFKVYTLAARIGVRAVA